MCNAFRMYPKDWESKWAEEAHSRINLRESYDVFPDQEAPIIRNNDGIRELVHVRWGLPSPPFIMRKAAKERAEKLAKKGKEVNFDELLKMEPDGGVTNVRNLELAHWKQWFGIEHRCVVPFTSFAEPDPANKPEGGRVPNAWFAGDMDCPVMFFAGIWVSQWTCVRKIKEGLITSDFFGFLTTEPNGIVAPIHQKAMPVILKTKMEVDVWMNSEWSDAKHLARPLPDSELMLLPT